MAFKPRRVLEPAPVKRGPAVPVGPVVRKGGAPLPPKPAVPAIVRETRCGACHKIAYPLYEGGYCRDCKTEEQRESRADHITGPRPPKLSRHTEHGREALRRSTAAEYLPVKPGSTVKLPAAPPAASRGAGNGAGDAGGADPAPEAPHGAAPVASAEAPPRRAEPKEAPTTVEDLVRRYRAAPWLFVREVLKTTPDAWQDECLHALVESGKFKFALKACKGPGKTCVIAWIILWFLFCFSEPKIICTSITGENLRDGLWTELAMWIKKAPLLDALFEWHTERITLREKPETWFAVARTWPKDADKTKQASTLAGQHAKHTMIVLDEGGGIPVGVLSAGLAHHSTQDPNVREVHYSLMAGNPETLDSALGWACTDDAVNWWVKEITGDPDDPKRAPRIDKKWAEEQIERFGRDNPWVLVNVFGKFPPVSSNKLLGSDQVRAAMAYTPHASTYEPYPKVMTLDVARSTNRDRSVLCRRQGSVIFPFKVYRLDDASELANQVAFEFSRWPAQSLVVDAVGIGGPVADFLRALGIPVVMFYGGLPARDYRFVDRRTETWWECAQAIKGKGGAPELALPAGFPELISEGCGPLLQFTKKGQMKLEAKEDMLKRGVGSPDIFDSLAMSFAEPTLVTSNAPESTRRALGRGTLITEYDPYADEPVAQED